MEGIHQPTTYYSQMLRTQSRGLIPKRMMLEAAARVIVQRNSIVSFAGITRWRWWLITREVTGDK